MSEHARILPRPSTRGLPASRRCPFVLAAIVAGGLFVVAAAAAAIPPRTLYERLLTTPIPAAQLPKGFHSPKITALRPRRIGRKYHVVGEVGVQVSGPDFGDFFYYHVFRNRADALATLRASPDAQARLHRVGSGVPGHHDVPNRMWTGTTDGSSHGVTIAAIARANVLVISSTVSNKSRRWGDQPATLHLLNGALHHLVRILR